MNSITSKRLCHFKRYLYYIDLTCNAVKSIIITTDKRFVIKYWLLSNCIINKTRLIAITFHKPIFYDRFPSIIWLPWSIFTTVKIVEINFDRQLPRVKMCHKRQQKEFCRYVVLWYIKSWSRPKNSELLATPVITSSENGDFAWVKKK